jgi:hypothetical protein
MIYFSPPPPCTVSFLYCAKMYYYLVDRTKVHFYYISEININEPVNFISLPSGPIKWKIPPPPWGILADVIWGGNMKREREKGRREKKKEERGKKKEERGKKKRKGEVRG